MSGPAGDTGPGEHPRALVHEAAAIGRHGRYSCHLHRGALFMYELVPQARTGEPGAVARLIGAVHHLPQPYLELHSVRRAIAEARENLDSRRSLMIGGG